MIPDVLQTTDTGFIPDDGPPVTQVPGGGYVQDPEFDFAAALQAAQPQETKEQKLFRKIQGTIDAKSRADMRFILEDVQKAHQAQLEEIVNQFEAQKKTIDDVLNTPPPKPVEARLSHGDQLAAGIAMAIDPKSAGKIGDLIYQKAQGDAAQVSDQQMNEWKLHQTNALRDLTSKEDIRNFRMQLIQASQKQEVDAMLAGYRLDSMEKRQAAREMADAIHNGDVFTVGFNAQALGLSDEDYQAALDLAQENKTRLERAANDKHNTSVANIEKTVRGMDLAERKFTQHIKEFDWNVTDKDRRFKQSQQIHSDLQEWRQELIRQFGVRDQHFWDTYDRILNMAGASQAFQIQGDDLKDYNALDKSVDDAFTEYDEAITKSQVLYDSYVKIYGHKPYQERPEDEEEQKAWDKLTDAESEVGVKEAVWKQRKASMDALPKPKRTVTVPQRNQGPQRGGSLADEARKRGLKQDANGKWYKPKPPKK